MTNSRRIAETSRRKRQLVESSIVAAVLALSVLGAVSYLAWLDRDDRIGVDFRASTWEPGNAILEGAPPYPDPGSVRLDSFPALYMPPYMLLFAPFSVLPFDVATGLWLVALSASIVAALWIAGLRDLRCYAIALLSLPVIAALGAGNTTALLMLSTALLWKWRDRPHHGAAAFACALLIKPLLWPLFVWLLVTRRVRLALEAAVVAPLVALVGWAAIGFDGLADYPALLRAHGETMASNGLLLTNLLLDAGMSYWGAAGVSLVLGACVLVGSIWVRDDLKIFTLGVAAALVMTPVMFVHYFMLLYVPLAARYARFSLVWLAPLPLWFIAVRYELDGTRPLWASVVGLLVLGAILVSLVWRRVSAARATRPASL